MAEEAGRSAGRVRNEPPFRVGRCFPDGGALHMIMAASSPGIFGGDWLQQIIHVGPGARVRLTFAVGPADSRSGPTERWRESRARTKPRRRRSACTVTGIR